MALSAAGCTAVAMNTVAHGIFPDEETNYTAQNYAAADYLVQQAKTYLDRYSLIRAMPLADSEQPGMESVFGKMIPEQVGVRLSQLGYRMDLSQVATTDDLNYIQQSGSDAKNPPFILSGTFTRRRIEVDVNLRMIDTRNGRIIAVFDYVLPRNREVDELSRPKPQIIRMTK
jgi:TolB-like protein